MSAARQQLALPPGTMVDGCQLEAPQDAWGFYLAYRAQETSSGRRVAIHELLPEELVTRAGDVLVVAVNPQAQERFAWARERFILEGRSLVSCAHPNLQKVFRVVEANGTAYWITAPDESRNFKGWLQDLGHPPTESELRLLLRPLLSALARCHAAGVFHLNLKPEAIQMTGDGRPVLAHFAGARQAIARHSHAASAVTTGYSPPEQYDGEKPEGAWTDIYGLAAVVHRAITGEAPPDAERRGTVDPYQKLETRLAGKYSAPFLAALDAALAPDSAARPQSIREWRKMLGIPAEPAAVEFARAHPRAVAGVGLACAIALALCFMLWPDPPVDELAQTDETKVEDQKVKTDEEQTTEEKKEEEKKSEEEKTAEEMKAAEEKKATEEKKAAEDKMAAEKKAAEEKMTAEEKKAAEDKMAAEKVAAAEKKAAEDKMAAEKKAAEEKMAAEKKAAEEKMAAEQKKPADEKKAAEQMAAQLKAAAENKKAMEALEKKLAEEKAQREAAEKAAAQAAAETRRRNEEAAEQARLAAEAAARAAAQKQAAEAAAKQLPPGGAAAQQAAARAAAAEAEAKAAAAKAAAARAAMAKLLEEAVAQDAALKEANAAKKLAEAVSAEKTTEEKVHLSLADQASEAAEKDRQVAAAKIAAAEKAAAGRALAQMAREIQAAAERHEAARAQAEAASRIAEAESLQAAEAQKKAAAARQAAEQQMAGGSKGTLKLGASLAGLKTGTFTSGYAHSTIIGIWATTAKVSADKPERELTVFGDGRYSLSDNVAGVKDSGDVQAGGGVMVLRADGQEGTVVYSYKLRTLSTLIISTAEGEQEWKRTGTAPPADPNKPTK